MASLSLFTRANSVARAAAASWVFSRGWCFRALSNKPPWAWMQSMALFCKELMKSVIKCIAWGWGLLVRTKSLIVIVKSRRLQDYAVELLCVKGQNLEFIKAIIQGKFEHLDIMHAQFF